MKKIYFFLTLALLCCVNAVHAAVTLGDLKTSVAAGDQVFIGSIFNLEGIRNNGSKWVSSRKGSLTYTESETPTSSDVFVLEASEVTISGQPAFYLKNVRNGGYVKAGEFDEDNDDGSIVTALELTENKAEAYAIAFVSAQEGAEIMKYKGDREVPTDSWMLLGQAPDENIIALNQAYSAPYMCSYNDWATWWQVYSVTSSEDPYNDLIELLLEVEKASFYPSPTSAENVTDIPSFIGGTNPGNRPVEVVDNLYRIFRETYDFVEDGDAEGDPAACTAKYAELDAAYQAVLKSDVQPMREGYFRLVSANTAFTVVQGVKKAMYATGNNAMWQTIDSTALNQVWEIKKQGEDTWTVKNMDTQKYFLTGSTSSQVTMAEESTNYISFKPLSEDAQYHICMQDPETPLHANGHSAGSGQASNIVLWNAGANSASAWFVEALDAEELDKITEASQQAKLNNTLAELLTEAVRKYNVAAVFKPQLTSPDQIWSNASQNAWGNADGGGYPALLDNDPQTYFHSCWGSGPDEPHFLQLTMNEEITEPISFTWTRRVSQAIGSNNSPKDVTIAIAPAGADTLLAESWTTVANVTGMSVTADNPTYTSLEYELPFPAKYVRWTVTLTGPNNGQCDGQYFFAIGEFQLFSGLEPDCQLAQMGEVGTALKAAIDEAAAIETATQADIDKLQAAIDAFVAELADPTELKAAITKASTIAGGIVYGTNPGQYPEGTTEEETLSTVLEQAEGLIESGAYTQTSLAETTEALNAAYDAFMAQVNPISTEKWYTLTFPSDYYTMTGGNLNGMSGKSITLDGDPQEAKQGSTQSFMRVFDEIDNQDMALWRFIALGDTAYAIQNKATGLYMNAAGSGVKVTQTLTPAQFKTSVKGYGCFCIDGYRLDNTHINPLHAQADGEVLVGWPTTELGTNSMWEIHEVDEVAEEVEGYASWTMRLGYPYMVCYPIAISEVDGASMYRISGISEDHLSLYDIAEDGDGVMPAGEPFILMAGTTEDYNTGDATAADTLNVTFRFGNEIQGTPLKSDYMVGGYYGVTAEKNHMVIEVGENGPFVKALTGKRNFSGNSAYINLIDTKLGEAENETTIIPTEKDFADIVDAIRNAVANVNKGTVDVYTTTGILVRKNVKAATATKGLPKGIYLVGGQKTAVK